MLYGSGRERDSGSKSGQFHQVRNQDEKSSVLANGTTDSLKLYTIQNWPNDQH
jgi:hypothetical protein